jgi:hypothetical protein
MDFNHFKFQMAAPSNILNPTLDEHSGTDSPVIASFPPHSTSGSTSSFMEVEKPAMVDEQPAMADEQPDMVDELDPKLIGMKTDLKKLYSGPEDKHGRFQWQDTIPKDIGSPAENAETAGYALIARYVKVYNDPRKVLALQSILVQSPFLKSILQPCLTGYPGFSSNLKRMELKRPFAPLVHRWDRLKASIAAVGDETEEEKLTKEHATLFLNILTQEFNDTIDQSQDMMAKGVIDFELIWTIFVPGSIVYTRQDGQEVAMKLIKTQLQYRADGSSYLNVQGRSVDWDGTNFGVSKNSVMIPKFDGTRKITSLAAFPLERHPEKDAILKRLLERGRAFENLAGAHYRAYNGNAWGHTYDDKRVKYNVNGRIMIDATGWNKFNPNFPVRLLPLNSKNSAINRHQHDGRRRIGDLFNYRGIVNDDFDDYDDDSSVLDEVPRDGPGFEGEEAEARPPLNEEQAIISTPVIRGYSLTTKLWLNFYVNNVMDISFSGNAFDRLVLPDKQKELILGFTECQKDFGDEFDDVIVGKGKNILLPLIVVTAY